MENINIDTAQNVQIEQDLASVGERILATIIDYVLFIAYFVLLGLFFESHNASQTTVVITLLPVMFYHLIFEFFFNGQSLGKMLLKIKVVKIDGSEAGIGAYFLRWIFRIVEITLFSGVIALVTILINGKGQRLGDIAAGTTVVRLKAKASMSDTIHRELPDNYQAAFPEVKNLTDKDITIINDVLSRMSSYDNDTTIILGYKTKNAIQNKTGIKTDMPPYQFLVTVLNDYNYLNRSEIDEYTY